MRFGFSPSASDLLRFFALHPKARVHLRRLEALYGPRSKSFQRDLRMLVEHRAITRVEAGARVDYSVDPTWPMWPAVRQMIAYFTPTAALVREAVRGVHGVEAAFVYGSIAKGTARPDSDVDVFVLGDDIDTRALHRALLEVTMLTGRPVNPGIYTKMKLAEQLGRTDSSSKRFLRDVLTGPKAWVAGALEALAPIAAAAGVIVTPPIGA